MSKTLVASGGGLSYNLIGGELPVGITLTTSTGVISGKPDYVYQTTTSEFVVRAKNTYGVSDRKFYIDIAGATPPVITTPGPTPAIGPSGEEYLVNNQFVDFQFTADTDVLPAGKSLLYYIADGDGDLPPGLTLTTDGRLYGQVKDTLSLFYRSASNGSYDAEGYDYTPYDHESSQQIGIGPRYVNKIYRFYLTVSNGAGKIKAQYEINVYDPSYFYTVPYSFPVPPQWLTPSDLGQVRSNTKQLIKLEVYDCDPGNGIIAYDWDVVNNNASNRPPGFKFNASTGILEGSVGYTAVYSTTYTFKLRVFKTDIKTNVKSYRDKTFTLTILGSVSSELYFQSDQSLGTLFQGETSELYIKASHKSNPLTVRYAQVSGSLPPGITMAVDGSLQGTLSYDPSITSSTTYTFTAKAVDTNSTEIRKTFNITELPYTGKKYTKVVLQPLLSKEARIQFSNFVNDQSIFTPEIIYRPFDVNFGVQTTVQFILEYGIKQLNLSNYVSAVQDYFRRKRLYFGNIKSAFAKNDSGVKIYEVVYVELIDTLVNNDGVTIGSTVAFETTTVYPNSIDNMRGELEKIAEQDEYLLPKFMRTVQDNSGIPLGRILCMPLCYCLPGTSGTIIRNIETYGIDFKTINFDLDRIIILNSLDNSSAKYLLFPNREVLE
jgi:hypothetical protein